MKIEQIFQGSSVTRLEAIQRAIDYQWEIASNPGYFNTDVVVQLKDGGLLFFRSCYLVRFKSYILVFPEHSEFSVHHEDEVEYWGLYRRSDEVTIT